MIGAQPIVLQLNGIPITLFTYVYAKITPKEILLKIGAMDIFKAEKFNLLFSFLKYDFPLHKA